MGEQTKYDGMTASQLVKTLTTSMISALETGRNDGGTAGVLGRSGTIVALIERGLVTAGRKNQWTKRGFEIAGHVLHGKVPAYVEPTPDPDSLRSLIGKRLDINFGVSAGRSGIVKRVDERRGKVTLDVDGHDVTCDKLNVSISAEQPARDGYYDGRELRDERARDIETVRALADRLDVPLDEIPYPLHEAADPATVEETYDELAERIVRRAQYVALRTMLKVVEGWREGARENHDGMGHRGENAGEQCWEHWHSSDIRTMVADAARELHVPDPNDGHVPTDLPAPS
jgi:hypothetical protein